MCKKRDDGDVGDALTGEGRHVLQNMLQMEPYLRGLNWGHTLLF